MILRDRSGQAMAEYAIVVAALLGVMVGVGFTFLPDFMHALQRYYDNFYIILNLPIP
jgi:Flp pilus assembly pilin Flp